MYNMDRLYEAVEARGPVCVGLDTTPEYIPPGERRKYASDAEAVAAFNRRIIDSVREGAACFKVQIACYEALGLAGLAAYRETLRCLRERGALAIGDIKRGDIADTAARYAQAHFEGDFEADFVTLSPYMGMDTLEPWLKYAETRGKGAFVLLRTSNRGMRDFQALPVQGGGAGGGRIYEVVGEHLSRLAEAHQGIHGYGAFGAVVGADPKSDSEREETAALRRQLGGLFFLIPGYGAQGGAAEDAALLLREGNGGVVNASRSILKAWMGEAEAAGIAPDQVDAAFAGESARRAVLGMRDAIRGAVKRQGP